MLWVTLVSVPLLLMGGIGIYGLYAVFFVMIADLFLIPRMTTMWNDRALAINTPPHKKESRDE